MIANQYGLNVETVAGVVSALSPNNKWDRNIIDAENLIRAYLFEIEYPKVCTFGGQRDKAIMMLENNYDNPKNIARVLNGNKTIAFYKGLATGGKCDEITVDGHAYNIWNGYYTPLNKVPNISDKLYAEVSLAYKESTNIINARVKISNIHLTIFKQLLGYAIGESMKLLSTLVLFFDSVDLELIIDYTVGFILAIGERIHWWT